MRALFIVSITLFSISAYANGPWWVYSGGNLSCEVAKFSPWQVLENGSYQLDRYFKDKRLVFLEHKDNPNNMLIYAQSKQNCEAIAQIVKQVQASGR